jgi:hypothetical protein
MNKLRDKITFYVSGCLYLLVNISVTATPMGSIKATLWQLLQTAPFIIGITWLIVIFLQYMANGQKMPWDRRIRLFFAVGIMFGLLNGIYGYIGVHSSPQ